MNTPMRPVSRARQWTLKAGFSILDQGLTSLAGFGLNILLARTLPIAEYGTFAVAFQIFLVGSSIHNSIIIEPMSVLGPSRHSHELVSYLRRMLWFHFAVCLGLGAAGIAIAAALYLFSDPLAPAVLAMTLCSPFILLFWTVRKAFYLETRAARAAHASAIHLLVLAALVLGLLRLHSLSAPLGFVALAGAATVAAAFSMLQLGMGLGTTRREAVASIALAREHWDFGRWLLPAGLFFPLLTQVQMFMTAAFLGYSAAGVLKALQNPILPVVQVVTALATLSMPVLARDFGANRIDSLFRRGMGYTALMVAVAVGYELAVVATGNLWDRALYGGQYAAYDWLMPVLGLVTIATALATGLSVILRALHRPQLTAVTHICGGVLGAISSYFLIQKLRLPGAVYGMVASYSVTALVSVLLTLRARSEPRVERPPVAIPASPLNG